MTGENAISIPARGSQSKGAVSTRVCVLAFLYLFLHCLVSTCLPQNLAPLSTFCIVVAEMGAMVAALFSSRKVDSPVRALWWLLASAVLFHSTAMTLDLVSEASGLPVFNHVPGLSVFFSMLYEVPLIAAVSMQFDRRILGLAGATNAVLSLAIGTLLYVQIFSLLTLQGSTNPADSVLILRLFDGIDLFLATAATIRWCGSDAAPERRFFRIATFFLWIDAVSVAIHNRMLIRHDYVWLDLLIGGPYVVLSALIVTAESDRPPLLSSRIVRLVQSGSAIFLSIALLVVGVITARSHFYLGLAGSLLSIVGYGALSTVAQSRGREAEESLQASNEVLEGLVGVDSLTGIPNRRAFDEMLNRECANAQRAKSPVSLIMIDVDHFKQLNDAYGHPVGDACLMRIADALQTALPRANDFVARYGGDEFAAILPATDDRGAVETARKICHAIAHLGLNHPSSAFGVVTVTVGLSTYKGLPKRPAASLVQAADRALYEAKSRGRNCCESFSIHSAGA